MQNNLVPYTLVDGAPTFLDSELKGLYRRMKEDNTTDRIFFGGGIDSEESFVNFVKSRNVSTFVVMSKDKNQPLAVIFLDGFREKTAYGHFVFFRETWGKDSVQIGRDVISKLLALNSIEMIYGLLPEENRLAIRFTEKIGGIRMNPNLPKGAWSGAKKKPVPAVMFYFVEDENANT